MKVYQALVLMLLEDTLYPTWFRWKHGASRKLRLIGIFISHMVQMKVSELLQFFSVPSHSLYPTWFRWKHATTSLKFLHCLLYIPHGSDERFNALPTREEEEALYPTWFRWKFWGLAITIHPLPLSLYPTWFRWKRFFDIPIFLLLDLYIPHGSDESLSRTDIFNTGLWLYIPHGSDEREVGGSSTGSSSTFISHMVQMKVVFLINYWLFSICFISHMVQMKAP